MSASRPRVCLSCRVPIEDRPREYRWCSTCWAYINLGLVLQELRDSLVRTAGIRRVACTEECNMEPMYDGLWAGGDPREPES